MITFAEFFLVVAVVAAFYFLMKPLQRHLENYFLKILRFRNRRKGGVEIDVTDYSKNKQKDKPNP